MPHLRLVSPDERALRSDAEPARRSRRQAPRIWLAAAAATLAIAAGASLLFWIATAERRQLRALPDEQRLPLYLRTVETLRSVCDPAPPRSLRDFCRAQAALASKFRECDDSPACGELVRRHLTQPRR